MFNYIQRGKENITEGNITRYNFLLILAKRRYFKRGKKQLQIKIISMISFLTNQIEKMTWDSN